MLENSKFSEIKSDEASRSLKKSWLAMSEWNESNGGSGRIRTSDLPDVTGTL